MDSAAFGTYALLWFITFVYMAAEWGEVTSNERDFVENDENGGKVSTIQAAIAFSFFAILIWVSMYMCVCLCVCLCIQYHVLCIYIVCTCV